MTPGQYRSHARFLRATAAEKRHQAEDPNAMPYWRKHWLADADRMDEDADWLEERAGWNEITTEWQEAAQ